MCWRRGYNQKGRGRSPSVVYSFPGGLRLAPQEIFIFCIVWDGFWCIFSHCSCLAIYPVSICALYYCCICALCGISKPSQDLPNLLASTFQFAMFLSIILVGFCVPWQHFTEENEEIVGNAGGKDDLERQPILGGNVNRPVMYSSTDGDLMHNHWALYSNNLYWKLNILKISFVLLLIRVCICMVALLSVLQLWLNLLLYLDYYNSLGFFYISVVIIFVTCVSLLVVITYYVVCLVTKVFFQDFLITSATYNSCSLIIILLHFTIYKPDSQNSFPDNDYRMVGVFRGVIIS